MTYIPAVRIARQAGRPRKVLVQGGIYPLMRRGLPSETVQLGCLLQSGEPAGSPVFSGKDRHFPLVCGDVLSVLATQLPNAGEKYVHSFTGYLTELYEQILTGDRKRFPNGFWQGWQGEVNLGILIDYLFNQKLGITMDFTGGKKTIDPRLIKGDHQDLLRSFGHTCWDSLFQEYKLLGGAYQLFDYSVGRAVLATFSWAFDPSTPEGEHAHPWDFVFQSSRQASDASLIKLNAVRHILRCHAGLLLEEEGRRIDPRLFPAAQGAFLREHKAETWTEFFRIFGLGKFTRWGEGKEAEQKIFQLLKEAFPWLFDLNTPEGKHLHYVEFKEQEMFAGPEGKRLFIEHFRHVLERHYGLRMDEGRGVIDQRLFSDQGQKEFLQANGFNNWQQLVRANSFDRIFPQIPELKRPRGVGEENGSLVLALQLAYPWAFDLSRPEGEHLHPWRFPSPSKWQDPAEGRLAVEHEITQAGISWQEAPRLCDFNWFKSKGLGGLVMFYDGSPRKLFLRLFPEKFAEGAIRELDFPPAFSQNRKEASTFRRLKVGPWGKGEAAFTEFSGVRYVLDAKWAGFLVRKESLEHALIFPLSVTATGVEISGPPLAAFTLVSGVRSFRAKTEEYDPELHPFLPQEVREKLVAVGILPQNMTIEQQRALLLEIQREGLAKVLVRLQG